MKVKKVEVRRKFNAFEPISEKQELSKYYNSLLSNWSGGFLMYGLCHGQPQYVYHLGKIPIGRFRPMAPNYDRSVTFRQQEDNELPDGLWYCYCHRVRTARGREHSWPVWERYACALGIIWFIAMCPTQANMFPFVRRQDGKVNYRSPNCIYAQKVC